MHSINLSADQRALLPSDDDVVFYETHGYYVSKPNVIPEKLIELVKVASDQFYRGERDARLPVESGYSNWVPADGDVPRNNEFVALQKKEFLELIRYPLLGAIAAKLTRSQSIRLLDDQLIYKPSSPSNANATITGWHADRAYWATCSSDKLCTAWIPFHDVDISRGPLVVMAGSHRWSGLQDLRYFNHTNLDELERKLRQDGKDVQVVPITLQKGQVSFHHCWTVHASYPNRSILPRLSYAVHLQDGDNHYRPYRNAQGREIHIFDEQLCGKLSNGDPDFSDPDVFPPLWSGGI